MADLKLRDFGFGWSAEPLWRALHFEWRAGHWHGLVGPNGAGKSTLLRLLAGWQQGHRGQIWVGEQEVSRLGPDQRPLVLLTSQPALYGHLDVEQNVRLPLRWARAQPDRSQELLQRLSLTSLRHKKPSRLSVGEQLRVAWARALHRPARWLLADEALTHLDGEHRDRLWQLLREWLPEARTSLLLVTHQLEQDLPWLDQVALLGSTLRALSPGELWEQPESLWLARQLCAEWVWPGGPLELPGEWYWVPPTAWQSVAPGEGWPTRWLRPQSRQGYSGWQVECRGRAFFLAGAAGEGELKLRPDRVAGLLG